MDVSEIISNTPVLLDQAFKDDLEKLFSMEDSFFDIFEDFLSSISEFEKLEEEKSWVPIAEKTKISISKLLELYRPVRFIATTSKTEKYELENVLQALSTIELLGTSEEEISSKAEKLTRLSKPILSLLDKLMAESPLPIHALRIKSIQTKCSVMAAFENEFTIDKDDVSSYEPKIQRLFPYVTMNLTFREDAHGEINIGMNEKDIDTVIKWLSFAKKQLAATKEKIKF